MKRHEPQAITISVYGAHHSSYHSSLASMKEAQRLGENIIKHDCIVTVPAQTGFSNWVAKGAKQAKGQVIAFSPAASEEEHVKTYKLPTKYMDVIIYSGFGFAGADLLLSRSSDAVIFSYGGVETIHEFWVAFQEGKPIGILKGEWDTEDILHQLLQENPDFNTSQIIFDNDQNRLLEQLIAKAKRKSVQSYHLS